MYASNPAVYTPHRLWGRTLPLPLNTHLVGSKPAMTASFSSLPDTSTAEAPSACRWRITTRLLLA